MRKMKEQQIRLLFKNADKKRMLYTTKEKLKQVLGKQKISTKKQLKSV